jgi:hypothetical protein
MSSRSLEIAAQIGWRLLRWGTIDAVLGTVGGAVFGAIFAVLANMLDGEGWRLIPTAGYFALCGAAAGALTGGFGAIAEESTPAANSCTARRESSAISGGRPSFQSQFKSPVCG